MKTKYTIGRFDGPNTTQCGVADCKEHPVGWLWVTIRGMDCRKKFCSFHFEKEFIAEVEWKLGL